MVLAELGTKLKTALAKLGTSTVIDEEGKAVLQTDAT